MRTMTIYHNPVARTVHIIIAERGADGKNATLANYHTDVVSDYDIRGDIAYYTEVFGRCNVRAFTTSEIT